MTLDLEDLRRRASGTESVGVSNAVLLELVNLAMLGEIYAKHLEVTLVEPLLVRRDPADPNRILVEEAR